MRLRSGLVLMVLAAGAAHADGWLPEQAAIRHASLLDAGGRFSRLIPTQAPQQSRLASLSREQLMFEKRRLEDKMPGLGGPIAITAVGGGGILFGIYYIVIGLDTAGFGGGTLVVLGAIALGVGVLAAAAGIVWLIFRIQDRTPIQAQLDEIEGRLNQIYDRGPAPLPDDYPPPPPPPPPPAVLGPTPVPMMMLARF